jgi:hypothetical protein
MKQTPWKIIFLTILSCWLISNTILRYSIFKYYYRPIARQFASLDFIKEAKLLSEFDYIILGDSTGMHSIIPELISKKTYSLCISGASLLDTYKVLSQIDLKKVTKGIILVNSFNGNLHYGEDFWSRFVLSGTYSLKDLQEMYTWSLEKNIFPSNQYSKFQFLFKAALTQLYLNKYAYEHLSNFLKSLKFSKNYYNKFFNLFLKNRGYMPLGQTSSATTLINRDLFLENYSSFYSHDFLLDKTDKYYLEKIYLKVHEAHLKFYVLTLPLAETSDTKATRFKQTLEASLRSIAKSLTDFSYLPINSKLKESEFFDYNHVNSQGAVQTSNDFKKSLNE